MVLACFYFYLHDGSCLYSCVVNFSGWYAILIEGNKVRGIAIMDWQSVAVMIIVVFSACYLGRKMTSKSGCTGGCCGAKPVEKLRSEEYWVGELKLRSGIKR
jgi:hypothetical protein